MRLFDPLRVRLAALFQRSRVNAEMEEELLATSSTALTTWNAPA